MPTNEKDMKEYMEVVNGEEVLFRDRVVGIRGMDLIDCGKVFETITLENFREFVDAHNMQEYGTTDFKTIMKMEGF